MKATSNGSVCRNCGDRTTFTGDGQRERVQWCKPCWESWSRSPAGYRAAKEWAVQQESATIEPLAIRQKRARRKVLREAFQRHRQSAG